MPQTCPRCGDANIHHSRPRSLLERFRRRLTGRVPFRCYACEWRGFRPDLPPPAAAGPREVHRELTDAELEALELEARGRT